MTLVLTTFLLVVCAAIAAVGYGSALAAGLRKDPNLGDRGVLGLLCLGFLGCAVHLLLPLDATVHYVLLGGGVVMAAIFRARLRNPRWIWIAMAVIFIYAAAHPQARLSADAGLYHIQTLRWIMEYPIVPGLVQLHSRLAFNSMLFPLIGVIDSPGLGWIANLLAMFFVLLSLVIRLWNTSREGRAGGVYFWCLLLSIGVLFSENSVYAPTWYAVMNADIFTAVLVVYCVNLAIAASSGPHEETELALLVLTAVFACMVKLAAAPVLLVALALVWVHRSQVSGLTARRVAMVAVLAGTVWLGRGYVLSGCGVYPVSATCAYSLPWAATEAQVSSEAGWIKSWARDPKGTPATVLKDWAWLPGWLQKMRGEPVLRLWMLFLPVGVAGMLFRRRAQPPMEPRVIQSVAVVALGLVTGLAYWFFTAPDVRFGLGFLLSAAVVAGSVGLASLVGRFRTAHIARFAPEFALGAMALVSVGLLTDVWNHHELAADGTLNVKALDYFYMVPPSATNEERVADKTIFVTKTEAGGLCWNHALPCTPYFDATLAAAMKKIRWPRNLPKQSVRAASQAASQTPAAKQTAQ